MPRLLRKFLGLILLITTIGLSTCQSMLEAAPVDANACEFTDEARMALAESGANKLDGLGLRHRLIQGMRRRGVDSTVSPARADQASGLSAPVDVLERGPA